MLHRYTVARPRMQIAIDCPASGFEGCSLSAVTRYLSGARQMKGRSKAFVRHMLDEYGHECARLYVY